VKVWVYHGDEIPVAEQETERLRARALATVTGGGASTGALITDEKEALEPAAAHPAPPEAAAPKSPGAAETPGAAEAAVAKPDGEAEA
jgi:hypothetical protein